MHVDIIVTLFYIIFYRLSIKRVEFNSSRTNLNFKNCQKKLSGTNKKIKPIKVFFFFLFFNIVSGGRTMGANLEILTGTALILRYILEDKIRLRYFEARFRSLLKIEIQRPKKLKYFNLELQRPKKFKYFNFNQIFRQISKFKFVLELWSIVPLSTPCIQSRKFL